MGHQINALPQAEHGDLRDRFRCTMDPAHWIVPIPVHFLSPSGSWEGAKILPSEGPYHHGVLESEHWPHPEPMEPTCGRFPGVFWLGQPSRKFLTAAALPQHEDMVEGPTG